MLLSDGFMFYKIFEYKIRVEKSVASFATNAQADEAGKKLTLKKISSGYICSPFS